MLQQFGDHRFFHRPLDDFGAEPILIIGQPRVGERHVEQLQELLHVHADDFDAFGSHASLLIGYAVQNVGSSAIA